MGVAQERRRDGVRPHLKSCWGSEPKGAIWKHFFSGWLACGHSANYWQDQEKGQPWVLGCALISVLLACGKHAQKTEWPKWEESAIKIISHTLNSPTIKNS